MDKRLKILKIIFLALLFETLVFFVAVLIIKANEGFEFMNVESQLIYLATCVVIVGMLIASQFIPRILLQKMAEVEDKHARISKYFVVSIIRWALIEASMLFCITIMLITSTWVAAMVFALLFLLFLSFNPSSSRIERELDIKDDMNERNEL